MHLCCILASIWSNLYTWLKRFTQIKERIRNISCWWIHMLIKCTWFVRQLVCLETQGGYWPQLRLLIIITALLFEFHQICLHENDFFVLIFDVFIFHCLFYNSEDYFGELQFEKKKTSAVVGVQTLHLTCLLLLLLLTLFYCCFFPYIYHFYCCHYYFKFQSKWNCFLLGGKVFLLTEKFEMSTIVKMPCLIICKMSEIFIAGQECSGKLCK